MSNGFIQYLQDTRAELRHVAWPTRMQTIVYSVLVTAVSVAVALYLGLFDFLFTTGLARFVEALPQTAPTQQTDTSTAATSSVKISTTTIPLKDLLPKNTQ